MSAGKIDRNPKNATPPAMIGMLSALCSARPLRICFHPRHGICVGFSAWMPGSSAGLGEPSRGRSGSVTGRRDAASFAAAAAAAPGGGLLLDALADPFDRAVPPGAGHVGAPPGWW